MDYSLTPKQKIILDAIRQYARQKGYMPTIRDICKITGLAIGTVSDHYETLKKKGWMEVDGTPRGIRLIEDSSNKADMVAIPLVGTIAAGEPIEAIETAEDPLILSRKAAKPGSFALRIRGNSMIDDHILSGDIVVVSPQANVNNGEIAVALLDDNTATLKRIYRENNRIRLQPANGTMRPIFVRKITVQGKVTSIVRMHGK